MNKLILSQPTTNPHNNLIMDDNYLETIERLNAISLDNYCKINSATIANGVLQCIFTNTKTSGYIRKEFDVIKLFKQWDNLKDVDYALSLAKSGILKNSSKGLYLVYSDRNVDMVIFNAGITHILVVPLMEVNNILRSRLGIMLQHDIIGDDKPSVESLTARPTEGLVTPGTTFGNLASAPTIDHVIQHIPYRDNLPRFKNGKSPKVKQRRKNGFGHDNYGVKNVAVLSNVVMITFTDIMGSPLFVRLDNDQYLAQSVQNLFGNSFQSYAMRVKSVNNYCSTTFDYSGSLYVFTHRGIPKFAIGSITNGDIIRTAYIPADKVQQYMNVYNKSPKMVTVFKSLD